MRDDAKVNKPPRAGDRPFPKGGPAASGGGQPSADVYKTSILRMPPERTAPPEAYRTSILKSPERSQGASASGKSDIMKRAQPCDDGLQPTEASQDEIEKAAARRARLWQSIAQEELGQPLSVRPASLIRESLSSKRGAETRELPRIDPGMKPPGAASSGRAPSWHDDISSRLAASWEDAASAQWQEPESAQSPPAWHEGPDGLDASFGMIPEEPKTPAERHSIFRRRSSPGGTAKAGGEGSHAAMPPPVRRGPQRPDEVIPEDIPLIDGIAPEDFPQEQIFRTLWNFEKRRRSGNIYATQELPTISRDAPPPQPRGIPQVFQKKEEAQPPPPQAKPVVLRSRATPATFSRSEWTKSSDGIPRPELPDDGTAAVLPSPQEPVENAPFSFLGGTGIPANPPEPALKDPGVESQTLQGRGAQPLRMDVLVERLRSTLGPDGKPI